MIGPSEIFRPDLLLDKVCLVTGGGTGIGAAISRELARLGATVVIASRKAEVTARAAEGLTEQTGRKVFAEVVDIRDRDAVAEMVVRERSDRLNGRGIARARVLDKQRDEIRLGPNEEFLRVTPRKVRQHDRGRR